MAQSAMAMPAISPDQAATLALNKLEATAGGYVLNHPRYSASFQAGGMRFQPKRGGPEWRYKLAYVGTGTKELNTVESGAVRPKLISARIVAYPRGSITEQYLMLKGSIEQQFIIPRPLGLDGENLIITGQVESDGSFETNENGYLWRTGEGVVTLGHVRVYDAKGRDLPTTMKVTPNTTLIKIDGASLANATYPVTVDPEIGTNDLRINDAGGTGNAAIGANRPSVTYDSTNNEYLVVWHADDTDVAGIVDSEFEIFAQRFGIPTVDFSSATYSGAENGGAITVTVSLSFASDETVTVDYASSNGTATAGSDYTAVSGTLTFSAGETSKTFTVTPIDDTTDENDETVTLTLSNASNATLGSTNNPATLTIAVTIPIPTMPEWAMIIFMILTGMTAVYYLKKREAVGSKSRQKAQRNKSKAEGRKEENGGSRQKSKAERQKAGKALNYRFQISNSRFK